MLAYYLSILYQHSPFQIYFMRVCIIRLKGAIYCNVITKIGSCLAYQSYTHTHTNSVWLFNRVAQFRCDSDIIDDKKSIEHALHQIIGNLFRLTDFIHHLPFYINNGMGCIESLLPGNKRKTIKEFYDDCNTYSFVYDIAAFFTVFYINLKHAID